MLIKQQNNEASHEDKIQIERYLFKKTWKVDDLTEEFLNKYYGKTNTLLNLRLFMDENKLKPYAMIDDINKYAVDFDNVHKLEQIKMIKEIIDIFNFIEPGSDIKINKETFEKNMQKCLTTADLFINPNKSQPLFDFNKTKVGKIETVKQFLGFVNSIFKDWGFVIKLIKKTIKIKNKYSKIYTYVLDFIDNINLCI